MIQQALIAIFFSGMKQGNFFLIVLFILLKVCRVQNQLPQM